MPRDRHIVPSDSAPSGHAPTDGAIVTPIGRAAKRPTSTRKSGRAQRQRTLKGAIRCSGTALHSGAHVSMTLHPAEIGTGVLFRRSDIKGKGAVIPARWDYVVDSRLCTVIGNADGVTVGTVEHLLAALAGLEIDNVIVDINGPEVPAMDGSAAPFLFLAECAGTVEQKAPRMALKVLRPVHIAAGNAFVRLEPADHASYAFEIDYEASAIGRQACSVAWTPAAFRNEVSRARTFGLLEDVSAMRAAGLARGGSLDNAVVVSGETVLNEDGLRFEDEFVRHKLLDAIGDMYLAGGPVIGRFTASCSGHAMNNKALRTLFADPDAYEWVPEPRRKPAPEIAPDAAAARIFRPAARLAGPLAG